MLRLRLATLLSALALVVPFASAQILHLAEMNTTQIAALDRSRTVLLLTNGIVEEHGPYLPTYTDGYLAEAVTADLARALVAHPGTRGPWTVVLFPVIPLGANPANDIGTRWSFPGSFTVQPNTIRELYLDLADSIGAQGFRHVLIVDVHGGPAHSVALDQASDYFHDTYGGRMTHLLGIMDVQYSSQALEQTLTPAQLAQNGLPVHADAQEQATGLFLRPDLSPATYLQAPDIPGKDFPTLIDSARKPNWPGYFGAPRYATPALGALAYAQLMTALNKITPDILAGKVDPSKLPRYGTEMSKQVGPEAARVETHAAEMSSQHQRWLAANAAPAH